MRKEYKENSIVKFRVVGRELYPSSSFSATPSELTIKYLPSASVFYQVKDADTEEVIVVASAIIDSSEITNPLYVIDGDDIIDDATTSLGEAVDSYLGVSIADYGAAIGQPIIRGMSGSRVKILKNGMVNREVSGLGADHLNDVDFNDLKQLEIVKGPSSLLYANGTIGGIINVVDECIAPEDYLLPKFNAGFETQSVNNGDSQYINYGNNINGFNINIGYKESNFGNYDIPHDAESHFMEKSMKEMIMVKKGYFLLLTQNH